MWGIRESKVIPKWSFYAMYCQREASGEGLSRFSLHRHLQGTLWHYVGSECCGQPWVWHISAYRMIQDSMRSQCFYRFSENSRSFDLKTPTFFYVLRMNFRGRFFFWSLSLLPPRCPRWKSDRVQKKVRSRKFILSTLNVGMFEMKIRELHF